MKFGETFMEYLHGEQERFLGECSHVEYKRLKKVLKRCRTCKSLQRPRDAGRGEEDADADGSPRLCQCEACPGELFAPFREPRVLCFAAESNFELALLWVLVARLAC